MVIEVLASDRPHGTVTKLAQSYAISRQSVYDIATAGREVLLRGLQPGPHGPYLTEKTIQVDRNRLVRGSVVLTEAGVSQRDICVCLAELLDTEPSLGWVNGELKQVEAGAALMNEQWQPAIGETLAGDEIYSHGCPNLLLVGNESLYIYRLTRQPGCDGDTWGCVLLEGPDCPQFASDAGTGLSAGVKAAEVKIHQADWDHLLRPLWGQATRLEKQAYAALQAVNDRERLFNQATTPKRLAQHLAVWERLTAEAEAKMSRFDAFYHLARQVDAQFGLIDLTTGQVRDPSGGVNALRQVGQQLQTWSGRIYHKLSSYLTNLAEALFAYQPVLVQTLTPLFDQWGVPALEALSRLWQLEADPKRQPLSLGEQQVYHRHWNASLDQALAELGPDQLWTAWEALRTILGRSWRGSMLAECVNSLLRPVLAGRKHTDQGCLDLFRFLHNVRPFARGKRAGHSPAQLVGLDIPDDPLILLGLKPKVSI